MKERKKEKKGKKSRRRGETRGKKGKRRLPVSVAFFCYYSLPQTRGFPRRKGACPPPPFQGGGGMRGGKIRSLDCKNEVFRHLSSHHPPSGKMGTLFIFLHCRHMSTMPCLHHVLLGACKAAFVYGTEVSCTVLGSTM